jgi:hypothetical protein
MDDHIKTFCEAREYIMSTVAEKVEVFMTGMWDPLMKHIIIKETCALVDKEIELYFPTLPRKYYPQIRFRIYEEELHIEVGLQNYLTKERDLTFLGTNDLGATAFDYYMRESWDPRFDYIFMARYGHDEGSVYTGSKTAEAEYALGALTPLSVAYGMAIEDGFIQ